MPNADLLPWNPIPTSPQMRCQFGHRRWPCFTKAFLWFFAKKTMCHKGWWRPALIQKYSRKVMSLYLLHSAFAVCKWRSLKKGGVDRATPAKAWNSGCERHPKAIKMRHCPKKFSKIWLWCFCCILFWMYVLVLFLFVVCLPLSQLRNNPGETSFWVVQVTSSDASEGFVARCALST